MIGSMFMLAAIVWLYAKTGSFDFVVIQNAIRNGGVPAFGNTPRFGFSSASSSPLGQGSDLPSHTWLPDAHVEAPTAGSVLLASVLLKMGTYGLLRFNVRPLPSRAHAMPLWIMVLALIGSSTAPWSRWWQPNMKKLIAYPRSVTLDSSCSAFSVSQQQG